MPTSTFQASRTCSWISLRLDPGGRPSSGVVPARALVGAPGGYGVSVGPLNADVEMYSRHCWPRYGKSACADGTVQWMSVSMIGCPKLMPRAAGGEIVSTVTSLLLLRSDKLA